MKLRSTFLKDKRARASTRWYCETRYAQLHSHYRTAMEFLLEKFSILVGVICFLDVPVTFFIGEIHPENGVLVPKPFFSRWIIPGLLLQLLVNPKMAVVSTQASAAGRRALAHGPVRVCRWARVVVFPLLFVALRLLVHYFWLPIVEFENNSRIVASSLL